MLNILFYKCVHCGVCMEKMANYDVIKCPKCGLEISRKDLYLQNPEAMSKLYTPQ